MPTDTEKPLNGTPEPFRRPVIWGRPPATVFRVGPLPKSGGPVPSPALPRLGHTVGILSGSMIPRAAPAPAPALTQAPAPAPREEPVTSPRPAAIVSDPDLTGHSTSVAEPAHPTGASPTPTPASMSAQMSIPPAVVAPDISTKSDAPTAPDSKPVNRTALHAGIAIAMLTVLALGGWIWTRSLVEVPAPVAVAAPVPTVLAPSVLAPDVTPESLPAPVVVTEPAVETPAIIPPAVRPAVAASAPAPAVAPTPVRLATPAPAVSAPPLIETAPAPAPAPAPALTEAERPQADPDAPIATRPQPLG